MSETKPTKVFVSYAWDDETNAWVRDFATRLRYDGIESILDQWETVPGDKLPEFMEKSVRDSDFVVFVCTPTYKRKSNRRQGGVGYEGDIVTGEILTKDNDRKFIPILRKGNWVSAAPSWAIPKRHIDLRGDPYPEAQYQELLKILHGEMPTPPPIQGDSLPEIKEHEFQKSVHENTEREVATPPSKPTAERPAKSKKKNLYPLSSFWRSF